MRKLIKLIPLNQKKEYIDGVEIEINENVNILKDFIVISCQNKDILEKLKNDFRVLKNQLNIENKVVIFNFYETPKDKIEFFNVTDKIEYDDEDSSFIL